LVFIVLISVITLALLALLVLGLHRYQLSIAQTNADKHNPLPPLGQIELEGELPDLSPEEKNLDIQDTASFDQSSTDQSEVLESTEFESESELESNPESKQQPAPTLLSEQAVSTTTAVDIESEEVEEDTEIIVHDQPDNEVSENTHVQEGHTALTGSDPIDPLTVSDPIVADPIVAIDTSWEDAELEEAVLEGAATGESATAASTAESPTQQIEPAYQTTSDSYAVDSEPGLVRSEENADATANTNVAAETAAVLEAEPELDDISEEYQSIESSSSASDLAFLDHSVTGESWQERVAELKKQERFDEALQVCRQEYPLWSAYQQASLIHRARIKQLSQENQDITEELSALYRLAAQASFLHDRVKGLPNLSLAQLKLLDLSPIAGLEMPYPQIGYTELRLIKKTDIKLLLDKWGKPATHIRPRELHTEAWKDLCGNTQSTLF